MVNFSLKSGASHYIIRVQNSRGFFREDQVSSSPAEIHSLMPYTDYTLSIMAVNSRGRSQPSLPMTAKTGTVWLFTFSVTRKHSGADLYIQNESCSHQEAENVYPITYHGLQKSLDLLYCLPLFEPNFRIWANAGLFYPVRAALGTFRAPPAYWSWQLKHNGLKLQVKNVISISRFPCYPKRRNLIKLTKNSVSSCNINHS